jgi:hypothetical protein
VARCDDRLPVELGHADLGGPWGTVGGEGGDDLVVTQSLGGHIGGRFIGEQREGDVELVGQEAEHVGGDTLAEADLDVRVSWAETREQPGNVDVARGKERSDPDAPAQDTPELVDLLTRTVQLHENTTSASGDDESCLGRSDATARALEQQCSQLAFEPSDLVR